MCESTAIEGEGCQRVRQNTGTYKLRGGVGLATASEAVYEVVCVLVSVIITLIVMIIIDSIY